MQNKAKEAEIQICEEKNKWKSPRCVHGRAAALRLLVLNVII